MHDTFWTLLRDRAHWEFEIFLMVLFDVMLAAIWRFIVRNKPRMPVVSMKTPQGICADCGGLVRHLVESGLALCHGCGYISVKSVFSTDAENGLKPEKNPDVLVTLK